MRINLKRRYLDDPRRRIYAHLLNQICDDYDLELSSTRNYFENSAKHLDILISYLKDSGYDVRMFVFHGVDGVVLSWGLEFAEDCELTLALILRYAEQEKEEA
jgi:hypothetical protein